VEIRRMRLVRIFFLYTFALVLSQLHDLNIIVKLLDK